MMKYRKALNRYPTSTIPMAQIPMNKAKSLGLTAFRSMIIDGRDNVVTAIINDNTVPNWAPLNRSASAIGIVPKISAYTGMPTKVAKITPKGLSFPSKDAT